MERMQQFIWFRTQPAERRARHDEPGIGLFTLIVLRSRSGWTAKLLFRPEGEDTSRIEWNCMLRNLTEAGAKQAAEQAMQRRIDEWRPGRT